MHHLHQNLLYGYDDKKKIFMAAGYENSGKLHTYTVSYSDMMAILKQNINLVIKVITYHQGFRFYRFVPEYIQEVCTDYLEERDAEQSMQCFLPAEKKSLRNGNIQRIEDRPRHGFTYRRPPPFLSAV